MTENDGVPLIDIRPDHWEIVKQILARHVPQFEVWAFGSRAKWAAKPYSDLDLAIISSQPLPQSVIIDLEDDFSESDLPWKVDIVDWASTRHAFQNIIRRDRVVIKKPNRLGVTKTWPSIVLNNALEVLIDYRGKSPPKSAVGIPVISAKVVKDGRILSPIEQTIEPEYYPIWMTRGLPKIGDVVMTTEGPLGEVAQLDNQTAHYALGQRIVCMRGKKNVLDNRFLKFLLLSPRQQGVLHSLATGTTVSGISQKSLRSMPIPLPPYLEQVGIGEILGSLDNKIELNRRMNETLEGMALAIFKDWFVDFGPTRAKMEGRAPYLAPDVWALFPDRLDGDGKPKGWATRPLDKIADFLNGLALQKFPPRQDGFLPVIKIAELRAGKWSDGDRASTEIPANYIVDDGDVLFSWSGSLLLRIWSGGKGALNQHLFKVSSSDFPKWFYYLWTNNYMEQFQAIAAAKATTMGHIQRHHLSEAITVIADKAVMEIADKKIDPLLQRVIANNAEINTLVSLRDMLLPMLMAGEVTLKASGFVTGHAA